MHLSSLIFLLSDYLLQIFLLFLLLHFSHDLLHLGDFVLIPTLDFFLFIPSHEIEWPLIPLNVDLECIKSILGWSADLLFTIENSLLFEEVLNRWLSYLTIIRKSVGLQSSHHILLSVMGSLQLFF